MKSTKWLFARFRSMSLPEVAWRVQQKIIQKSEYKHFYFQHKPVTEISLTCAAVSLKAYGNRLGINWENKEWSLFESLDLFGVYDYKEYRKRWNAGFQTDNTWPVDTYSSNISIGQREDIGDIRTNWELNRHFQFVGLAKNYYVTNDEKYLSELQDLFYDWNKQNLFLHGVQWVSAMEVAIRIVSWSYMYAFLEKKSVPDDFLRQISNGIIVMAEFVMRHRARFSSANNHLIVEMLGVAVAGILFNCDKWINYSISILTEEFPKQNYPDGVNKEMSLHYQVFEMEAYGIVAILIKRNGLSIPSIWMDYLSNMSQFVADCCGDYGETIVFGDNDEGKILDFCGKIDNHYHYVLHLMGIVLSKKYTECNLPENIQWLATNDELNEYRNYNCYKANLVSHYEKGGYTILRSNDRKVLIGIDHAEMGFGSIAAHGHCDALSIQVKKEGKTVLADTGSFNYHVPKKQREIDRITSSHNTVSLDKREQAQMLGPFLWGERYKIRGCSINGTDKDVQITSIIKYAGANHKRTIIYDYNRTIKIIDEVAGADSASQNWILPTRLDKQDNGRYLKTGMVEISSEKPIDEGKTIKISEHYNQVMTGYCYIVPLENRCETNICVVE